MAPFLAPMAVVSHQLAGMQMLTDAQKQWFKENPDFGFIGRPHAGAPRFAEFGTLYRDGRYVKSQPMKPIKLEAGCVGVGRVTHGQGTKR